MIIERERVITIAKHSKFRVVSFKSSPNFVNAIAASIENPTISDKLKNLFLNGFDLNILSFVLAVNIKNN